MKFPIVFIFFYNLRAFEVKFLILVILINYSMATNIELTPERREQFHNDESEGYTTASFKRNGNYSELEELEIKNQRFDTNAVYSLINDASKKAPQLKTLSLGRNKIKGKFDLGKLHQLKQLIGFWMPDNTIDKFIYSGTEDVQSLGIIGLNGNKIRSIDLKIFERFPHLQEIDLSDNQLIGTIDLGKLQPMKELSRILFNDNMITKINNTATENVPSVRYIGLTNNKLTSVKLNDFAKFVNLQDLRLDGNKITSIDGFQNAEKMFENLIEMSINRNEFKCAYLKKILEPYAESTFWYNTVNMEESCTGPKSVFYKEVTCCYP